MTFLIVCSFQVKIVSMNENMVLRAALDKNLKSAVTTACLMLPESFSEEDLFIEIAGLSYSGLYGVCPTIPRETSREFTVPTSCPDSC